MVAPAMVVPAILLASSALSAGSSIYSSGLDFDYQKGYNAENERFWADYKKNTGFSPRYPYRVGGYRSMASMFGDIASASSRVSSVFSPTGTLRTSMYNLQKLRK